MPNEPAERTPEGDLHLPAWRRHTNGEQRCPGAIAILGMIVLQLFLPDRLSLGSRWLMPAIELILIGVLVAAYPGEMERRSTLLRRTGLTLIVVASLGTAWAVGQLVFDIATGVDTGNAAHLLATGGNVWLINVLTFAVWSGSWTAVGRSSGRRAAGSTPISCSRR